jgi:hypothetical protein
MPAGFSMRLLDLVAQSSPSHPALAPESRLPAPHHFADTLRWCPLRLVLTDEIVHCATTLAHAEGDQLSGCLDLLRVPAERLWVEWAEPPRRAALTLLSALAPPAATTAKRRGVLIEANSAGRAGTLRTFWSAGDDTPHTAAMVSEFDLDRPIRQPYDIEAAFGGAPAGVSLWQEPALDGLLQHIRSRMDASWQEYFRAVPLTTHQKAAMLRASLAGTVLDTPMLWALFLIMGAKDGALRRTAKLERINRVRRRSGKMPLLEHVEVSGPLYFQCNRGPRGERAVDRRSPHRNEMRGHLARRGSKIFWHSPHLRGNARQGAVRSRTVELSFFESTGVH